MQHHHSSFSNLLCDSIAPQSLNLVCQQSLGLIQRASNTQINEAITHNQQQINRLLVQLLAIDYISQNQNQIEKELHHKNIHDNNNGSSYPCTKAKPKTKMENKKEFSMENYCANKLLALSPILGFSQKSYFEHYDINDDLTCNIFSYINTIDIFKTLNLINKQFNENVNKMHGSYKYCHLFTNDNFTFKSFSEANEYFDDTCIDGHNSYEVATAECAAYDGLWTNVSYMTNSVRNVAPIEVLAGQDDGDHLCHLKNSTIQTQYRLAIATLRRYRRFSCYKMNYSQLVPYKRVSQRPANLKRFKNLLKRGYCNATCDINLKKFNYWTPNGKLINIANGECKSNEEEPINDIWRCGIISFTKTWAVNKKDKNGSLTQISQICVKINVDSESGLMAFNNNDNDIATTANNIYKPETWFDDRGQFISLYFHIDDVNNLTHFGNKTKIDEQNKTINYMNLRYPRTNEGAKLKIMAQIDPNNSNPYCIVGPGCILNGLNKNEQKMLNDWESKLKKHNFNVIKYECESLNMPITQHGLSKVYFDDKSNKLKVKLRPCDVPLIFKDSSLPEPIEKEYIIVNGSPCRLIEATITDERLLKQIKNKNNIEEYFEALSKWKGFLVATIDITNEFNQFEERLKEEFGKSGNSKKWENGKCFMTNNSGQMSHIQVGRQILYNVHVSLDSPALENYNDNYCFFNDLKSKVKKRILGEIFKYTQHQNTFVPFGLVCKEWNKFSSKQ